MDFGQPFRELLHFARFEGRDRIRFVQALHECVAQHELLAFAIGGLLQPFRQLRHTLLEVGPRALEVRLDPFRDDFRVFDGDCDLRDAKPSRLVAPLLLLQLPDLFDSRSRLHPQ